MILLRVLHVMRIAQKHTVEIPPGGTPEEAVAQIQVLARRAVADLKASITVDQSTGKVCSAAATWWESPLLNRIMRPK